MIENHAVQIPGTQTFKKNVLNFKRFNKVKSHLSQNIPYEGGGTFSHCSSYSDDLDPIDSFHVVS